MLAQIQNVDPGFLKEFLLVVIGLLGGAGTLATIYGVVAKRRREIEPQPLEVSAAPRFTRTEECVGKHLELGRRLDGHDSEIEQIWSTLRAENTAIRHEMQQTFQAIERALGRIEGKLEPEKRK